MRLNECAIDSMCGVFMTQSSTFSDQSSLDCNEDPDDGDFDESSLELTRLSLVLAVWAANLGLRDLLQLEHFTTVRALNRLGIVLADVYLAFRFSEERHAYAVAADFGFPAYFMVFS